MLPSPSCFMLLTHEIPCARIFALANAGKSIAARMAMIAMTTNNSIKVKPPLFDERLLRYPLILLRDICFIQNCIFLKSSSSQPMPAAGSHINFFQHSLNLHVIEPVPSGGDRIINELNAAVARNRSAHRGPSRIGQTVFIL